MSLITTVGSSLGLTGQFLRFQVPGKTATFDAPDATGKYEQSYIPLREGSYKLVTVDNRIVINLTRNVDGFLLDDTIHLHVTYNGNPYADATINVSQKGTFTTRIYSSVTNQNGDSEIKVNSNGPESGDLAIIVTKDEFNYAMQSIHYFIGTALIVLIAIIAAVTIVGAFLLVRRKRKNSQKGIV